MHIGYIGMGIMGSAMAANLARKGFSLAVWNRTIEKCEPLKQLGATVAGSVAELSTSRDLICLNVTDTPDVESILFSPAGVAAHAKPGTIVIDHSTISPDATREFAKKLAEKRITLLDAPVSGGDVGARNGTLAIMVGGDAAAFQRALPVFEAVGKKVVHVGPSGCGQTCKACNQVAVLATLAGVCEAIELARRSGLDPAKMIDVVGSGAGGSWQLSNLGPRAAADDFAPGFMIDLAVKDMKLVVEACAKLNLDARAAKVALDYLQAARQQGHGRSGTQAMITAVRGK